jgi:MSHA biogenesis protein MshP
MEIKRLSRTFFQGTQQKIKAQGSALILALFIIIVLTFLGMALIRVLSTSSETIAQEVIGTRALMAANSGMQAHLQKLFPLNPPSNSLSTCPVDKTYNLPESGADIPGLYHCKATTKCTVYFEDTVSGINYYRLTSTGECGTGDINANASNAVLSSRTIQVEARSL